MIAAAALATASAANAGYVGVFGVTTSTGFSDSWSLGSTPLPDGSLLFSHQVSDSAFTASGTFFGEPENPSLGAAVQVANGSIEDITFVVDFTMPIDATSVGQSDWSSSVAASLNGTDASLAAVVASSLWTFQADGNELVSFMPYPFELTVSGSGSDSAVEGGIGTTDWAGVDALALRLEFVLSPGASVSFNGGLSAVPAPSAALTLIGLGLGLSHRRRRR